MRPNFDKLSSVVDRYEKIFFEPLRGNHGDDLIRIASLRFLEDHDKKLVASISEADVVVINGGGGMTSKWGFIKYINKYIQAGARAIIVLPSSIHVPRQVIEEISSSARDSRCALTVFARERATYTRLSNVRGIDLYDGHDMAFYLEGKDCLDQYLGTRHRRQPYSLIVERKDAEGTTNIAKNKVYPIPFKKFIPTSLKRPFKRMVVGQSTQTDFYRRCKDIVLANGSTNDELVAIDISSKSLISFGEFVNTVVYAENVFTNRLHVCILRSVFGKPCYLSPTGGEYKKNEAVYEQSMKHHPGIHLL